MEFFPHASTPVDRALQCVNHHRIHELSVTGLTAAELAEVRDAIHHRLNRARLRYIRSHVVGAGLTAVFLVIGIVLMMIGPTELLGRLAERNSVIYLDAQTFIGGILIVIIAAGGALADFILRRRLKVAKSYGRRVGDLTSAQRVVDDALHAARAGA